MSTENINYLVNNFAKALRNRKESLDVDELNLDEHEQGMVDFNKKSKNKSLGFEFYKLIDWLTGSNKSTPMILNMTLT